MNPYETEPIPWGKIKAHLPTDLAKLLLHYQVIAEKVAGPQPKPSTIQMEDEPPEEV